MLSNATKCSSRQGVIVNSILITGNNIDIFDGPGLHLEAILKVCLKLVKSSRITLLQNKYGLA